MCSIRPIACLAEARLIEIEYRRARKCSEISLRGVGAQVVKGAGVMVQGLWEARAAALVALMSSHIVLTF